MNKTTKSTSEEEKKNISSLVKEVSAFFHREMKKQEKKNVSSLSRFKERVSREYTPPETTTIKNKGE